MWVCSVTTLGKICRLQVSTTKCTKSILEPDDIFYVGPPPFISPFSNGRIVTPVLSGELTDEDPLATGGGGMFSAEPEDDNIATGDPGSVLEVKRLDEVLEPMSGKWNVKPTPVGVDSAKKIGKYDAYAFTVVRRFTPAGPIGRTTGSHMTYSVTKVLAIQSPELIKVGSTVIGQVHGVSWTAKPLRVSVALR